MESTGSYGKDYTSFSGRQTAPVSDMHAAMVFAVILDSFSALY
jgi:hypothetical protein